MWRNGGQEDALWKFRTTDQPRQGLKPGRKRRRRGFPEAPSGAVQGDMVGGDALVVFLVGRKKEKSGISCCPKF